MGNEWNCHREALNMGALGGSVWSWLGQEVSQGTWEITLPSLFPGADKQVCKECAARVGSCSEIPAPTSRRWSLFSRSFILWDDSRLSCQEGRGFQRGRQPPTRPSVHRQSWQPCNASVPRLATGGRRGARSDVQTIWTIPAPGGALD